MSRRNEHLYHIYYGMKARCYNPKNPKFYLYGGKEITVCDQWLENYDNFREWQYANGYMENSSLSIDRIDSDKNYCPGNCQWLTVSENSAKANTGRQKNKSKKGKMFAVDSDGITYEITDIRKFCIEHGLNRSSVSHRLNGIVKNPEYCGWKFYRTAG